MSTQVWFLFINNSFTDALVVLEVFSLVDKVKKPILGTSILILFLECQ